MLAIVDCASPPPILKDLPKQFEEWEQSLSRFRSTSELCQLNSRSGSAVAVSQVLWDVFEAACKMAVETSDLVNPLIMDALIRAGYDRSFDLLQPFEDSGRLSLEQINVPALSDIVADEREHKLCLPAGGHLDFGGVAKGWAAEKAMEVLSLYGPALFSAGGDIAVSGLCQDGEPWSIDVDDPFQPGAFIETLYVGEGGVATSGKDYRNWTRGGIPQHHIIDPRNGLPAETDILTATVIAPSSLLAEALAKAVLISGSQDGMAWLDSDDRLAGLLVLENGQRLYSRNIGRYL
ncbi:MAG: FAD:protein FMN transferase [Anaerolineales bacterium]